MSASASSESSRPSRSIFAAEDLGEETAGEDRGGRAAGDALRDAEEDRTCTPGGRTGEALAEGWHSGTRVRPLAGLAVGVPLLGNAAAAAKSLSSASASERCV